jgi:hypothetical protein
MIMEPTEEETRNPEEPAGNHSGVSKHICQGASWEGGGGSGSGARGGGAEA